MIRATIKSKVDEDICLMLNFENHAPNYLCDCGFASELTVKDCRDVAAIFVSHTHIDHFIGFDNVMRHQMGSGKRVIVCGSTGLAKHVQAKLQAYQWNLLVENDPTNTSYEVREVTDNQHITVFLLEAPNWERQEINTYTDAVVFENEAFSVRYTLLDHGVPSVAYLFEEPTKVKLNLAGSPHKPGKWAQQLKQAYAESKPEQRIEIEGIAYPASELFQWLQSEPGYRLGYIMDHHANEANHQKIRNLLHEADEVYIESYYTEEEKEFAEKNKHSTARQSGKVAREAQIKKAIPVHFSRRYHQEDGQQTVRAEFFAAFTQL